MASPVPPSGPLSGSEIYILQGELITTALQFWLHGLYMTLLCIAVYNLITHKAALTARKGLLVATFVMFVCSNLQVIEQLAFNVLQLLTLGAHPPNIALKLLNIRLSLNVFGRVNYLMSDAIVVWRAWLLYHDNLKVRILLGLCLLGSLVGATTHMTFGTLWLYGNLKLDPSGSRALIMVLPLLVTNVVATSLMTYKVWQYRQQIKAQLDLPKDKTTKVERILVILTESGTIYCLIWIPFLYTSLTNQGEDTIGYKIVANIIPQLSAIYPIVIVLLVSLDRTQLEFTITSNPSQPIRFVVDGTGTRTGTRTGTGSSPNAMSLRLDAMHSDEDSNSDVAVTNEKGAEPVPLRDYL
ncbi:hypothetical protein DFH08DRAFT_311966 [Mycena albidolilacea]|uniref:Uncharacterized protein n=1 Tax=Mycena albidolilacea TaxID=1033008 RepID=A0AAD6ZMF6_9AGAR|nr:hypothetical protein DFH08DRAFT_311966 [Mycena albidolilacea]